MRPAFRRGWEGEGKPKSMPGRGPAGAQATATRGRLFRFGNERAKPLAFPHNQKNGGVSLPQPRRGSRTAPLHGVTPTDALRRQASPRRSLRVSAAPAQGRSADRPRASGKERGKSASGSVQRSRALRSAQRGTERVLRKSRSICGRPFPLLPIVTRMGRDYRPGSRQRIERVARRAASQIALKLPEAQGSVFQAARYRQRAQTRGFPVPRREEAIAARCGP